jgi:serine/threonine protein kinase/tetratricopeptide (TPR) repeat protein
MSGANASPTGRNHQGMAKPDLKLWQTLSPYLDQALEMDDTGRTAWLASIREENPSLARDLETLLDDYRVLRQEGFLEMPSSMVPLQSTIAGQTIGAYQLIEPIGQGGMGSVWLARRSDGRFERQAAVKFLNIALAGGAGEERFKREGTILGRLADPHIAQLLDAGVSASGQPYLVLEHVPGEPIDRYCDSNALDIESRVRLFLDVLAAVAHAHANLIVHRDIKPSNVLVSADGQVKLLDFGIAKLLENENQPNAATMLTRNAGAVMTLLYAAPEQLTGGTITTATDVYALGVLLYVLLTGQHPSGPGSHSSAEVIKSIIDAEQARASDAIVRVPPNAATEVATIRGTTPDKLRRQLREDLDTIVAKALKKDPRERYTTVTAMSEDLGRYLKHEPIAARPDTISYRAAKFVRRNRTAVVLAALVLIATIGGLVGTMIQARTANRQRLIAQKRFNDVRQLSTRLFDIDARVSRLPGNSDTREFIVDTSLNYLRRLADEVHDDPDLALEVGTAYLRVGRVQGVPINSNLGQVEKAEQNLRIAERLIASVLEAQPGNHIALLRAAQIAHDRMVLAEDRRPDTEALPLAYESAKWLDKYLSTGPIDETEKNQVAIIGMNVANWYFRKDRADDGMRLIRKTIEIEKATNQPGQQGSAQMIVARALRRAGDLEGALAAIREGMSLFSPNQPAGSSYRSALATEAAILGEDDAISLGRSQEAIEYFNRAIVIAENFAKQDSRDSLSWFAIGDYATKMGGIVRHSDPHAAIDRYDEALHAYAQINNNSRARREEVRALAGSTYPLVQIGNSVEARKRLDAAFSRLKDLSLYPSDQIELGAEADKAVRALAEFEAGSGNVQRGIEIYQELLGKIMANNPKPETDLEDATDLSNIYRALAQLQRRVGQAALASSLESRRLELWQQWDRRLPNNSFVGRQIAAIPAN